MEKDNFLEESIKKCVEHAMLQDDDKKQWFVDDMIIASQKETEELQDRIDKALDLLKTLDEDTLSNMQLSLEIIGHIEYILKGSDKE